MQGALPQGRTALYFDSSDDEDPWLKNPPAPAAPQAAPVPAAKPSAAVKNHHKAAKPASVEEDSDDDWNFSDDDDAVKNKGNCSRQASKKPATQPGKKLAVGGKATGGKSNAKIAPKPRAPKTKVLAKAAPKRAGAKAKPDAPKLAPDQRATRGKAPGKAGAAAGKAGAKQVDLRATSDDEWDQDDAEWSPLDASDYLPLTQAFVNGTDKSPSPTPSLSPPAQPQQAKHGQQRRGRPAPAPALKKLPEAAPAATVKGLKAALARGIKPQQGGNNAQEALLNRAGSEEEQSPPPSSTKRSKAQGRLAAMLGRGRAGAANKATHAPKGNKLSVDCSELFADEEEGDGALPVPQDLTLVPVPGSNKAKKGTPAAAGALLQRTITPATAQGKKQDTGLHAPATGKLVSKMPEAARGAAQAQGPEALQRGKRPAAAAAGAKVRHSLRLAASSSDDEVEDLRDSFDPVEDSEAGDGGDLGMGLSAPPGGRAKRTQAASNLHLSVINAAKGRKAAAEAEERERAVTAAKAPAAGRQRFAAAALKPDDAFAVYLESDSEDEGPGNDATAALVAMLTGGGRAGPKRGRRSQSSCGTDR